MSKNPNQRSIIVKFCRRDRKIEILTAARQSKVQQFFVNEHLTATQKAIGFVLRKAKREFPDVVSGSTTFDGKHCVWVKPPNPDAPGARDAKITIQTYEKLSQFCTRTLGKPVSYFIDDFPH